MLYELRLYTVVPGRMEDNHARFASDLPTLMARHGIRNVGRWTATAGPSAPLFVYLMAYTDLAEREKQWRQFYDDAEWWKVRARTNAGSEMVERYDLLFLAPSPVWAPPAAGSAAAPSGAVQGRIGGVHELIFAEVAVGRNADANSFLKLVWLPLLQREGARVLMVADFVSGTCLPRVALMLAWPDATRQYAGRRAIDSDPALRAAQKKERDTYGRTSIGRSDIYVLEPTPFDLPLATLGMHR